MHKSILRGYRAWAGVLDRIARVLVRHHVMSSLLEVPRVLRLKGVWRPICPGHHSLLRAVGRMVRGRIPRSDAALRRKAPLIRVGRPAGMCAIVPVEIGLAGHSRVVVNGRRAQGNLRHLRHKSGMGVASGVVRAVDAVATVYLGCGRMPSVGRELFGGGGRVVGVDFAALPGFVVLGVVGVFDVVVRVGEGFFRLWCRMCNWPASFSVHEEEQAGR